jgi:hypothetical protein
MLIGAPAVRRQAEACSQLVRTMHRGQQGRGDSCLLLAKAVAPTLLCLHSLQSIGTSCFDTIAWYVLLLPTTTPLCALSLMVSSDVFITPKSALDRLQHMYGSFPHELDIAGCRDGDES